MQLANRRAALFALTLAAIASAAGASRTGVDGERSRLRQAERAPIEVQRCERAPSRSAALDRPQREVIYDAAGRPISIVDAMGTIVTREFDALARPELVRSGGSPAAAYGYQGPDLVAQKELGNGLSGQMSYDAARRRVETAYQQPGAATPVVGESVSRSPRGQIVSVSRTDEGGSGFVARYDGAGRLTEQGRDPSSFPGNNTLADPLTVAGLPDSSAFRFDAADNLLAKTEETSQVVEVVDLPPDDSHRNRPASIQGASPLEWDANGNLSRKGPVTFRYDYRNRLTEVVDSTESTIASYRYDALNRRVEKRVGEAREETVWSGWQSLETYRDGTLSSRRTYGLGLDEIVKLEQDRDGDGALDEAQVPLYDTSGNLVALTRGTDGTPVEKYAYSPFGEQRIFVDLTRPRIEQLRREGDALLLEVSEKVQLAALAQARENGDLTLTDTSTGQPIEVEVSLPVLTGRTARKRIRIHPTATIAESTPLRLHLAPKAVLDFFQNPLEAAYDRDLVWSATGSALSEDTAAPQLDLVRIHENVLTVGFTETIDVAQATTAITVDGNPVTWIAEEDGYGLRTDPPLANGQHRIEIAASLEDLAGTPLGAGFARTVEITPAGALVYVRPDPREISSTAASNPYGFQGLPRDPETGFVYARNRYYDPEIGRFISTDPLGYVDGGNLYQYGLNDPVNNGDPMGLWTGTNCQADESGKPGPGCVPEIRPIVGNPVRGAAYAGLRELPFSDLFFDERGNVATPCNRPGQCQADLAEFDKSRAGKVIKVVRAAAALRNPGTGQKLLAGVDTALSVANLGEPDNRPSSPSGGVKRPSGVPPDDFVPNPTAGPYKRATETTAEQRASVQGLPCVDCGEVAPTQVADHIDPEVVQHYRDGRVDVEAQRQVEAVQPHCPRCSARQGSWLARFSRKMKKLLDLR